MAEWIKASRLNGVLRYNYKTVFRFVAWALLIVLAVQALSLLMPVLSGRAYPFDGVRANFEIVFFAAFLTGILTAGRSSRFLLRFGTSRTAVWLGNVLGLLGGMIALLLATFLLNMLVGALLIPLANLRPDGYAMTGSQYGNYLRDGLGRLPEQLLYTLEWTSIFYLYGCVLRRFRVFTISVSVAAPLLLVVLMLIPAVRDALRVINGDNQGQMVLLGLQWLQFLQDVVRFIEKNWNAIQLAAGIVSLPVSYLIMRGTKQP